MDLSSFTQSEVRMILTTRASELISQAVAMDIPPELILAKMESLLTLKEDIAQAKQDRLDAEAAKVAEERDAIPRIKAAISE